MQALYISPRLLQSTGEYRLLASLARNGEDADDWPSSEEEREDIDGIDDAYSQGKGARIGAEQDIGKSNGGGHGEEGDDIGGIMASSLYFAHWLRQYERECVALMSSSGSFDSLVDYWLS